MALKRRFKLVFTEEIITDEGYVVKEKPPVIGQIVETEEMLQKIIIPEVVISKTMLQRLYMGLNAELDNSNHALQTKDKKIEVKIEEPNIEQIITPLYPQN